LRIEKKNNTKKKLCSKKKYFPNFYVGEWLVSLKKGTIFDKNLEKNDLSIFL